MNGSTIVLNTKALSGSCSLVHLGSMYDPIVCSISSVPMLFIVDPHITGIISPLCIPIIIPFCIS